MKVIIVDDQKSVIEGIKSGVDWEQLGVTEIYTAENASEAKAILKQYAIDVMLCDIEMPEENGLQLFHWVTQNNIDTVCIFLTSHSEFTYAQAAIKLGAFDYVIAPAPYSEIYKALESAIKSILKKENVSEIYDMGVTFQNQETSILSNLFRSHLSGTANIHAMIQMQKLGKFPKNDEECYLMLIQIVKWYSVDYGWEGNLVSFSLTNIIDEIFQGTKIKTLLTYVDETTYGLVLYRDADSQINEERIIPYIKFCRQFIEEFYNCGLAICVSEKIQTHIIPEYWKQLVEFKENNVSLKKGVFFERDEGHQEYKFHLPKIKLKRWYRYIKEGQLKALEDEAIEVLDEMSTEEKVDAECLWIIYQDFIQLVFTAMDENDINCKGLFNTDQGQVIYKNAMKSIDAMKELVHYVVGKFHDNDDNEEETMIYQIIEYIDNHVEEEIRRDEIAEHVYLSPDYLTRFFKKEMGMTIKAYIIQRKMIEAKSHLKTTNLPINIIAARLGYMNFSHFSSTYKKIMGVTPQEERQKN